MYRSRNRRKVFPPPMNKDWAFWMASSGLDASLTPISSSPIRVNRSRASSVYSAWLMPLGRAYGMNNTRVSVGQKLRYVVGAVVQVTAAMNGGRTDEKESLGHFDGWGRAIRPNAPVLREALVQPDSVHPICP